MFGFSSGQFLFCATSVALAISITSAANAAGKADDAFGIWDNGGARVEVFPCSDTACVRIVRQARNINPRRRDTKNPDPEIQIATTP